MSSEKTLINQYAHQYLNTNIKLILFITVPVSFLFFAVALMYDILSNDSICSFFPILCGLISFCFCYVKTLHFAAMIHQQEALLGVVFPNIPLAPLHKNTLFYHSNDWFIRAGCWAFHRDYIEKTVIRVLNKKSPAHSYAVDIYAVDHQKIVVHDMQFGEIRKFKLWLRSSEE